MYAACQPESPPKCFFFEYILQFKNCQPSCSSYKQSYQLGTDVHTHTHGGVAHTLPQRSRLKHTHTRSLEYAAQNTYTRCSRQGGAKIRAVCTICLLAEPANCFKNVSDYKNCQFIQGPNVDHTHIHISEVK